MLSRTTICNMALSNANQESALTDVDTESGELAERCRQWYDPSRLAVLAAYDWSFARKRVELVAHADDPPPDRSYRYQYPLDCIAIRRIEPYTRRGKQRPYSLEHAPNGTRSIVSNIAGATMRYTFDQTDALQFSPGFAIALGLVVGSYLVGPTTGRNRLKESLLVQANVATREAAAVDLNTEQEEPEREADWILARDEYGLYDNLQASNVFVDARNLRAATGSSVRIG